MTATPPKATPYPKLTPSSRSYDPGNWAVKSYNAMSGAEVRIRYGDKRFNAKLSLKYQNIPDESADKFLTHYEEQFGTFKTFTVPNEVINGWTGSSYIQNEKAPKFKYQRPPAIVSVRPGVSNVSVELIGVI